MTADAILQTRLPCLPWMDPRSTRLPGIQPLHDDSWTFRDDAYAGQMRRRDALIAAMPERVHALLPEAEPAAQELYRMILARLARDPGYQITMEGGPQSETAGRAVPDEHCMAEPGPRDRSAAGRGRSDLDAGFPGTAKRGSANRDWANRGSAGQGLANQGVTDPIAATRIIRPDGVEIRPDPAQPLLTLGRLVQEDLCILEAGLSETGISGAGEAGPGMSGSSMSGSGARDSKTGQAEKSESDAASHRLTGAILCFPAGWTLSQKIGRSLLRIHEPVEPYDPRLAKGVQRLFDAIRPEQPLWRMNFLTYDDPELHQPRPESQPRPRPEHHRYIRCEKQALIRLPETRAVVFSIHTWIVPSHSVTPEEHAALLAAVH